MEEANHGACLAADLACRKSSGPGSDAHDDGEEAGEGKVIMEKSGWGWGWGFCMASASLQPLPRLFTPAWAPSVHTLFSACLPSSYLACSHNPTTSCCLMLLKKLKLSRLFLFSVWSLHLT